MYKHILLGALLSVGNNAYAAIRGNSRGQDQVPGPIDNQGSALPSYAAGSPVHEMIHCQGQALY